jgi:hypothetical protein
MGRFDFLTRRQEFRHPGPHEFRRVGPASDTVSLPNVVPEPMAHQNGVSNAHGAHRALNGSMRVLASGSRFLVGRGSAHEIAAIMPVDSPRPTLQESCRKGWGVSPFAAEGVLPGR